MPTAHLPRASGALLVALTILSACDAIHVGQVATLADLTGRWRAQPFMLDEAFVANADRYCRGGDHDDFPAAVNLMVVDARGDGSVVTAYDGPTATAWCDVVVGPTGELTDNGWGWGGPKQVAPGELAILDWGGGRADGVRVIGLAGAGIARVVVTVPGVGPVTASTQNGWFSAWWPGSPIGQAVLVGYDGSATQVTSITGP